jgi:hypothetical protein
MSRYLFSTENGELSLPLESFAIARCIVDEAFSLEVFRDHEVVSLRIEGPFTVTERGAPFNMDPAEPQCLGPAVALINASVRKARASAEGRIRITFEDGRELTAEPSDDFEAWSLAGPKDAKAVCRVGGGISTWGSHGE